jgi:hypothetical protein
MHVFPILPHMRSLNVPTQDLPHVKSIALVIVIADHPSIYRVPHLPIQLLCNYIFTSDKQINEPGIVRITLLFECLREECGVAEPTRRRRDGEGGDVTVPWEIVWVRVCFWVVGLDWRRVGRCFELSEDLGCQFLTWVEDGRYTVALDLTIVAFYDAAEVRPFGKIFKIERHVVGLGEVVEVAGVKVKEIHGRHWADRRHSGIMMSGRAVR